MTPAEVLVGARALAGLLPEPAGAFASVVLGIGEAILGAGGEWRRTAALVHDVVESYRRSEETARAAMRQHWQERAAAALRGQSAALYDEIDRRT